MENTKKQRRFILRILLLTPFIICGRSDLLSQRQVNKTSERICDCCLWKSEELAQDYDQPLQKISQISPVKSNDISPISWFMLGECLSFFISATWNHTSWAKEFDSTLIILLPLAGGSSGIEFNQFYLNTSIVILVFFGKLSNSWSIN